MGKGDGVIEQAGASPGAGRPAKMHDEKGVAGLPKLSTTSLTMVSKLTNKMTVDEVGTVMKDRFSKLSLPSLKTDNGGLSDGFIESKKKQVASPLGAPALSPNDLKFIPSWKDGVVVPEEEGYDDEEEWLAAVDASLKARAVAADEAVTSESVENDDDEEEWFDSEAEFEAE